MGVQVKSLAWKLVLPVPLVLALLIAAAWTIIPDLIASNTRQAAVASAIETVAQFKTLRGYYTKNVIAKVKANGSIKPAIDHAGVANRVPLPATLIHDLSQLLHQQNTSIRLYSAFPFPNRKTRQLDDFQTEAWAQLSANPEAVFTRQTRVGENTVVRVAIADTMSAKGCVGCHNAHPDTPKNDWQLGDVRGVLEVDAVIDDQLAAGSALANKIVTATSLAALIVLAISLYLARHVIGPVARMSNVMNRLAEGEKEFDITDTTRSDE
jgi:HAMP domain-containing protein